MLSIPAPGIIGEARIFAVRRTLFLLQMVMTFFVIVLNIQTTPLIRYLSRPRKVHLPPKLSPKMSFRSVGALATYPSVVKV